MADILEFTRRDDSRRKRRRGHGQADVVIFPGVRIEREEFSLADRVGIIPARNAKVGCVAVED